MPVSTEDARAPSATPPTPATSGPGFTSGYDTLIRVTRPPVWAALVALLAVILAIAAWGVFGSLHETVKGPGIVVPEGGVTTVTAQGAGVVRDVAVRAGDTVRAGQTLMTVGDQPVVAGGAGTVIQVDAADQQSVSAGTPLVLLGAPAGRLEAVAYVPFTESGRIQPGQHVSLSSLTQAQSYLSRFEGTVESVSPLPVSAAQIAATVGSPQLAEDFGAGDAVAAVRIRLRDAQDARLTQDGDSAAERRLAVGTLVDASVVVSSRSPLDQVFQ